MPFCFEMSSLVCWNVEDCMLPTSGAFQNFLLSFFIVFIFFNLLFLLLFLLLFVTLYQELQNAGLLLILKIFCGFVGYDIYNNLNSNIRYFFIYQTELSILIWLYIINTNYIFTFYLFGLEVFYFQSFQLLLHFLQILFFACYFDSHVSAGYFVFSLQKFNTLKCLFLSGLVGLYSEVDLLDSLLNCFLGKSAFGDWMHTFLYNYINDFRQDADLLGISFLVSYLQLSQIKWEVPLSKMIQIISSLVLLGKNLFRSAFLTTSPCDAFSNIQSVWRTSETSFSTPFRQLRALLRQQAISKCLLLILQRMMATLVILMFVKGCFNIILLLCIYILYHILNFYTRLPLYIEIQLLLPTHQFAFLQSCSQYCWEKVQIIMKQIILFILISTLSAGLPSGFSYISEVDPTIIIRANYARQQNFRGQIVAGYLRNTAIISTAAAYALKNVQSSLRNIGYGLVIYDAYRPQKAVDDMVAWTKQPENYKTKDQFYPYISKNNIIPDYLATKSGHSKGSTVDLTIIRFDKQIHDQIIIDYTLKDGRVLKIRDDGSQFMCGHFDLFDQASHHDTMLISSECLQKRNLLRNVMAKHDFLSLQEEWWHYRLQNEPFPSTYFDFNVE